MCQSLFLTVPGLKIQLHNIILELCFKVVKRMVTLSCFFFHVSKFFILKNTFFKKHIIANLNSDLPPPGVDVAILLLLLFVQCLARINSVESVLPTVCSCWFLCWLFFLILSRAAYLSGQSVIGHRLWFKHIEAMRFLSFAGGSICCLEKVFKTQTLIRLSPVSLEHKHNSAHAHNLPDKGYVIAYQGPLWLFFLNLAIEFFAAMLVCCLSQPVLWPQANHDVCDVHLPWLFATEITVVFQNAPQHGYSVIW
jgi:hypothetical protein